MTRLTEFRHEPYHKLAMLMREYVGMYVSAAEIPENQQGKEKQR